ncbi:NAD(P)-dependent dehydrogenase (short-subunit alcohol dehydrogenase family) [Saccharothrix tamanrassetensis]|uniref:NAD(P)-dependent dehydrogenase (Short-subunit alcohol dehydrogenase family) n=2 Tax=Saccharothrix tamanrassetensis TaxID=1051531 RepID=A0A841CST1_9PSEU|nr:NAD(P)-dependent dehydrogenase (short-subunit alcohol dehydrogenase family) [Saccharothrix tamanrassetensis]
MGALVGDLLRVVGDRGPVHLVGHDWGSVIGWQAVARHPEAFLSFTSISGPDLGHVGDWVRRHRHNPAAVLGLVWKSWYIAGFKVPVVPELVWRMPWVRRRLNAGHRELVNGLELYRANIGHGGAPRRVAVRVQQIALQNDPYVSEKHLEAAEPWTADLTRRPLFAGHWAPRTHPEQVARMVEDFIDGKARRQLVVVTGAGSGIGRATALRFAREGAEVIAVDIDLDTAEKTAAEARGHAYGLDVTDSAATHELARRIKQRHGVPDVVVANAGVGLAGPFLQTSEEDWRRVVDVNLWGVVHTLRAFAPLLVERAQGGHLVVTASMAGFFPTPALPAYSTTKAAVLMLAQCLAAELRPHGVGVSAICPGVVDTNITATTRFAGTGDAEQVAKRQKAGKAYRLRGFRPERVADQVLRAVQRNRTIVPVTAEAKFVRFANRVSPRLVRALGRVVNPV